MRKRALYHTSFHPKRSCYSGICCTLQDTQNTVPTLGRANRQMLAALCMNSAGAMMTPTPHSTPSYRRVECGQLGSCNEAAGLRDPNEQHEARGRLQRFLSRFVH